MNFLRKSVLVLITPIFCLLLFATAFDMGFVRIVDQPSNIKQILVDSGVYSNVVNNLLNQAKTIDDTNDSGGTIDLNNPTIKAAANATITPQFVRSNTESVIDSIYAWLNGQTAQPNFNIDLSNTKSQFASTVAQAVETRATTLPVCSAADTPSDFDSLSASCLPAGVTPAAAASEVQGEIIGGKGFLDNTVINSNTIKTKGSNQSIFSGKLSSAPKQYQRAKKSPVILAVATFLVALAIVFLSASRRRGLRRVGIILLIMGLFMLLFAWGLNYGVNQKAVPKINLSDAVLQQDVRHLVTDVVQKIDRNYWLFGGIYAALGFLLIGASLLWPKGQTKTSDDLEGEGKTQEDRIDLKERDQVTDFGSNNISANKPKPAPKKKTKPKVSS